MNDRFENTEPYRLNLRAQDCGCCYASGDDWLVCPCEEHRNKVPEGIMPKVVIILSADDADPVSCAIQTALHSHWSHARLGFYTPGNPEKACFFESVNIVDSYTHKTGVRGPLNSLMITDWKSGHDSRRYIERVINLYRREVCEAFLAAMYATLKIEYSKLDCMKILSLQTAGFYVVNPSAGSRRWTCSEMVARCLRTSRIAGLLHMGDLTFDVVAPSGVTLPSLEAIAYGLQPATADVTDWYAGLVDWKDQWSAFSAEEPDSSM